MTEIFLLALAIGAMAACMWTPVDLLFMVGAWAMAAGGLFGIPLGVAYHVALYRALKQGGDGEVPKGWLWRPVALHRALPKEARDRVQAWFFAGGAGFVVLAAGLVLVVAAILRGWMPE